MPEELKKLIVKMAIANVSWGEERIAHELLVKLGVRVSPRTVRKYMPNRDHGGRGALSVIKNRPRLKSETSRSPRRGHTGVPLEFMVRKRQTPPLM